MFRARREENNDRRRRTAPIWRLTTASNSWAGPCCKMGCCDILTISAKRSRHSFPPVFCRPARAFSSLTSGGPDSKSSKGASKLTLYNACQLENPSRRTYTCCERPTLCSYGFGLNVAAASAVGFCPVDGALDRFCSSSAYCLAAFGPRTSRDIDSCSEQAENKEDKSHARASSGTPPSALEKLVQKGVQRQRNEIKKHRLLTCQQGQTL